MEDVLTKQEFDKAQAVTLGEFAKIRNEMSGQFALMRQEQNEEHEKMREESGKEHEKMRLEFNLAMAKFFGMMEKRFDRVDRALAMKADKDDMQRNFDSIIKRLEVDDQERAALEHQVDRHEGWIRKLAAKTETKLA